MQKLCQKPLTRESFARFGDVIDAATTDVLSINEGNTQRFHDLAHLDLLSDNGKPSVNIFRLTPLASPITVSLVERHPKSSQTCFSLEDKPYLVVVAPPGELDMDKAETFLLQPDQGVSYHRGIWHHYSLATEQISDFLVIDRIADHENCDEVRLSEPDQRVVDY